MKSEDVKRFGVILFESLDDHDKKTGLNLYNTTLKYKTFQEENLHLEYYDINSKKDFIEHLNSIVDEAIANNYFYFFHFEIHGYNGGITLKNSETVSWEDILPILRKLNIHYHNYLGIYLAVCEGASLIKFLNPLERSPFGFMVASPQKLGDQSILVGFEKFYEDFFFSLDAQEAVDSFNSVTDEENKIYLLTSKYLISQLCDENREGMNKKELLEIIRKKFETKDFNFHKLNPIIQNVILEQELKRSFEICRKNTDYYLMSDLK